MELTNRKWAEISLTNTLSSSSLLNLEKQLEGAKRHGGRVVIVRGASSKIFCQGLDLKEALNATITLQSPEHFARFLLELRSIPKVVISLVEGMALGGGIGIIAASDYVIASESARFGLPETAFGLIPAIVQVFLAERLSPQQLRTFCLLVEAISANKAREFNLVDEIVTSSDLVQTLKKRVRTFSYNSLESIRAIKKNDELLEQQLISAVHFNKEAFLNETIRDRIKSWLNGEAPWMS